MRPSKAPAAKAGLKNLRPTTNAEGNKASLHFANMKAGC